MNYTTYGTVTFPVEVVKFVQIAKVSFADDTLIIRLKDGRAIHLDMGQYPWLQWLRNATPEQRSKWEIVPSGGGVWWTELDEGIELQHLLDWQPLV
jgi:hypothetical protein